MTRVAAPPALFRLRRMGLGWVSWPTPAVAVMGEVLNRLLICGMLDRTSLVVMAPVALISSVETPITCAPMGAVPFNRVPVTVTASTESLACGVACWASAGDAAISAIAVKDMPLINRVRIRAAGVTCIRFPLFTGLRPSLFQWAAVMPQQPFLHNKHDLIVLSVPSHTERRFYIGIRYSFRLYRQTRPCIARIL